jgi:hypothetical protein
LFTVIWPLLILFCALVFLTQWITKHIQGIGYLLSGDGQVALLVYFVLILPGVFVHELSHALVAWVLGVKVRKLSIGPRPKGRSNTVALGSVEIASTGPLRASLIGLAPLIAGSATILLISGQVFGLRPFPVRSGTQLWQMVQTAYNAPDFWLWVYLVFAISNAMLPSSADRHAWGTALLFLTLVVAAVYFGGVLDQLSAGRALSLTASVWMREAVAQLTLAFGVTVAVDLVVAAVLFVIEQTLALLGFGRLQYR